MVAIGIIALVVVVVGSGFFVLSYRPWQLSWGATREELVRRMPGDEVVPCPTFNTTRAVTVGAKPEDIWPWLVQIGFGRGGWYSYDIFDNLGRHSTERIIPAFQHVDVDDLIPIGPGATRACA